MPSNAVSEARSGRSPPGPARAGRRRTGTLSSDSRRGPESVAVARRPTSLGKRAAVARRLSAAAYLLWACADPSPRLEATGAALRAGGERAYPPSELRTEGRASAWQQDAQCADCHPGIAAEWQASAHAFSSFDNPIYVASVERLRSEVGFGASRLCGGCHDPVLLTAGGLDSAVDPADPRAHAGVTCTTCHGLQRFDRRGNASYLLAARGPQRPRAGDAASVAAHRRAMGAPLLRDAGSCIGCHRSFLDERAGNPAHLGGVDDVAPWQRSPYAGSRTDRLEAGPSPQSCQGCHMPRRPSTRGVQAGKRVASHRFAGGHTWLAAMLGEPELAAAAQRQLRRSIRLDIAVVDAGAARLLAPTEVPGPLPEQLVFHVVLENVGVGHAFPGGTRDLQDIWLEALVQDGSGRVLAASRPSGDWSEAGVHRLLAVMADARGNPVFDHRTHDFRAPVVDTTLEPRGLQLVRYSVSPSEIRRAWGSEPTPLPWRLTVVARHRSRNPRMQAAACASSRSDRGRALAAAAVEHRGRALDPCGDQPVTELHRTSLDLVGEGQPELTGQSLGRARLARLSNYVRALQRELPERLGLGLRGLDGAARDALQGGRLSPLERADWALSLSRLHAAQGRTGPALELIAQARALAGPHPALDAAEGHTLASVWQFERAARAYAAAAAAAPADDRQWLGLSRSLLSLGVYARARRAAEQGLARDPRSEGLLLVLAKSSQALDPDSERSAAALADYLAHRTPDAAPHIAASCRRGNALCRLEHLPVHEHHLAPTAPTRASPTTAR